MDSSLINQLVIPAVSNLAIVGALHIEWKKSNESIFIKLLAALLAVVSCAFMWTIGSWLESVSKLLGA